MSKVKNVLCFVLALAMVFALAVPAFAANSGEEGIEPQGIQIPCPNCGYGPAEFICSRTETISTKQHGTHRDSYMHFYDEYSCPDCGLVKMNHRYAWYCPTQS